MESKTSLFRGIIFDFNGVLLLDTPWHREAWQLLARELRGTPFTQEEWLFLIGRNNQDILLHIFSRKVSSEEVERFGLHKEELYRKIARSHSNELHLSPGAKELFDWLVEEKIPHTIATSSEITNLDFFCKEFDLERWFDRSKIIYDDGTLPCKPNPELYVRAAASLKLSPSECVVIEDAASGIRAAHSAGIGKIIALGDPEDRARLLTVEGVTEVISSLVEFNTRNLSITPLK